VIAQHLQGGLVTEQGRAPPVERAGRPAALDVAQDRDPGVLVQTLLDDLLHVVGRDGASGAVSRTLGDDDDRVAASGLATARQLGAHPLLPAVRRRVLGDEHVVTATGDRCHQRQIAAVPTHHLDDEAALVGRRRRRQRVDSVHDAPQGGVGPDRHIGADQVVVDRADESGETQVRVGDRLVVRDLTGRRQLGHQLRPFGAEGVQPGQ